MGQPRKLVLTDWTKANNMLMQYFEGKKAKLAEHLDMSRTTITNFFNGQPVREAEFRKISLALNLNWSKISRTNVDQNKISTYKNDSNFTTKINFTVFLLF